MEDIKNTMPKITIKHDHAEYQYVCDNCNYIINNTDNKTPLEITPGWGHHWTDGEQLVFCGDYCLSNFFMRKPLELGVKYYQCDKTYSVK
jgi:hypothetical protein